MTNGVLECFRCHTPIPESSRFCSSCGADISGAGTGGGASTSSTDVMAERLGRLVEGKYRIERLLGKGGMGAVFLAHDLTLEREVAIKVLPPDVAQDEQVVRRFQQEAKTAARLDHPNIIPIYRVESEGGLNYFVMKYIVGTSLEDLLDKKEPLPVPDIQRILWEAACALGHAHLRGAAARQRQASGHPGRPDGRDLARPFQGSRPAVSHHGGLRHRRLAGAARRVACEGEGARSRAPPSRGHGRRAYPDHRGTDQAAPPPRPPPGPPPGGGPGGGRGRPPRAG